MTNLFKFGSKIIGSFHETFLHGVMRNGIIITLSEDRQKMTLRFYWQCTVIKQDPINTIQKTGNSDHFLLLLSKTYTKVPAH